MTPTSLRHMTNGAVSPPRVRFQNDEVGTFRAASGRATGLAWRELAVVAQREARTSATAYASVSASHAIALRRMGPHAQYGASGGSASASAARQRGLRTASPVRIVTWTVIAPAKASKSAAATSSSRDMVSQYLRCHTTSRIDVP